MDQSATIIIVNFICIMRELQRWRGIAAGSLANCQLSAQVYKEPMTLTTSTSCSWMIVWSVMVLWVHKHVCASTWALRQAPWCVCLVAWCVHRYINRDTLTLRCERICIHGVLHSLCACMWSDTHTHVSECVCVSFALLSCVDSL